MPFADIRKQREYNKLRMRKVRNSRLVVSNKTILEQMKENIKNDNMQQDL